MPPRPKTKPEPPLDPVRELSRAVGHRFASAALLFLSARPGGVGVVELADGAGAHRGQGIRIAEHLRKHNLVTIQRKDGFANKPWYAVQLTDRGKAFARALHRLLEDAPPKS